MANLIYKIATRDQWDIAEKTGRFDGAPIDVLDGYIHFSTASQAHETAEKHFAGQDDLLLIAVDAEALGDDLKWEQSRGGDLFPHLYAALHLDTVVWAMELPLGDNGVHVFPDMSDVA